MAELFDMGQYAAFLWSGWAISALGLGGLTAFVIAERARAKARLKRAQQRADQRGAAA